jgi:hypothetical protein
MGQHSLQAVNFNIFEGQCVQGVAEVTISRGKVVWQNNEVYSRLRKDIICPSSERALKSLSFMVAYVCSYIRRKEAVDSYQHRRTARLCMTECISVKRYDRSLT